jgi:hypothetical protein
MTQSDETRCVKCGRIETALGGDVHCHGDCDDSMHGHPDGCHRFVPPSAPPAEVERCRASVDYDIGYGGEYSNCAHSDLHLFCDGTHANGRHGTDENFSGDTVRVEWDDQFYPVTRPAEPQPREEMTFEQWRDDHEVKCAYTSTGLGDLHDTSCLYAAFHAGAAWRAAKEAK